MRPALLGSATVLALTVLAGTAGGRSAAVSLSVGGNASAAVTVAQGKTVSLVSRAALRTGDRLVIAVTRGSERRLRNVAACRRSPCRGSWTERSAISGRFQALVRRGAVTSSTVVGKSRVVRVTWKTAPPPPPAPATPGHYAGKSTFNETFDFDVSADGKAVVDLRTGQINESCTPRANISGGNLSAPGPYPIAADGSFSIGATITIAIGNATGTRKIAIIGRFSGASASGTIRTDTTFAQGGTNFVCNSGDQTWSATKV
jgi:hypothetical protein